MSNRLIYYVARAAFIGGWAAAVVGLLWMLWLPVLGDWHDFHLPFAVAWTGLIVALIGMFGGGDE